MAYVKFNKTATLAEAKASTNPDKVFFPTDSKKIIKNGKEFGGEDGTDPVEIKSMNTIVPNSFTDGLAALTRLRGNTIKWNQLAKETITNNYYTFNNGSNIVISGTPPTFDSDDFKVSSVKTIARHKYYAKITSNVDTGYFLFQNYYYRVESPFNMVTSNSGSVIVTETASWSLCLGYVNVANGTYKIDVRLIDLTAIFGKGNEPTSVEEVEAYLAQLGNVNLPYSEGTITPVKMTGVKSVGFNLWDEEWEANKYINVHGEVNAYNGTSISRNYIRVIPSTTYFYYNGTWSNRRISFYDIDKNFISQNSEAGNGTFVTPSNCNYIKFYWLGTTYNHDICINISDANKNGIYKPYNGGITNFNVTQLRGKLNGVGNLVYPFSNGMNGFNGIYDEVLSLGNVKIGVKRYGKVDLGTLNYTKYTYGGFSTNYSGIKAVANNVPANILSQKHETKPVQDTLMNGECAYQGDISTLYFVNTAYKDAPAFKSAMQGVELIYELATPEYYILEEPNGILPNIPVEEGGVVSVLPDNTDEIVTAAPLMDIRWRAVAADVAKQMATKKELADTTSELESAITAVDGKLISEGGDVYYNSDGTVKLLNHPDISTQASILPQKYDSNDILEVKIPLAQMGKVSYPQHRTVSNYIPNNAVVLKVNAFSDTQTARTCYMTKQNGDWKISVDMEIEDADANWYAIVQYYKINEPEPYYYAEE